MRRNLNYWDSVSTLAGEVPRPHKTVPAALGSAVVLVVLTYALPLLVRPGSDAPLHATLEIYQADTRALVMVLSFALPWLLRKGVSVPEPGLGPDAQRS